MSDTTILEVAKQTISSAYFVGITERFDLSTKLLFDKAGFEIPKSFFKLNEGKLRKKEFVVTPEIEAAIQSNVALDIAIYRYALSRLETLSVVAQ